MREIEEQPASVEYADGQVAVLAENSSLSEIIRDVARRAGMAVKGSIVDERVFGTYGPAAPAEVLAELLKGTDSNMMVLAGKSHVPELILSPKQGEPTPPPVPAEVAKTELAPDEALPVKESDAGGQASTNSDKAGLSEEKTNTDASQAQAEVKPAPTADPQNDTMGVPETAAH